MLGATERFVRLLEHYSGLVLERTDQSIENEKNWNWRSGHLGEAASYWVHDGHMASHVLSLVAGPPQDDNERVVADC